MRYMRYENSYPAQVYIDGADKRVRARFIALARMLSEVGRLPDGRHGHYLQPPFTNIFELKPGDGRLFGFFHERTFYVTNGADKKSKKEQRGRSNNENSAEQASLSLQLAQRTSS